MKLPDFLTEQAYGEICLTGHRIGLMHLIDSFNQGYSAEELLYEFPTLSRELINQVLSYYRDNRTEVDNYLARCHEEMDRNHAGHTPGPGITRLHRQMELIRQAD